MPSLIDSLSNLADRSESITNLSHANYRSTGPFTHAYLNTPSVLHLIRDAEPAEARLFKYIGEEHSGNKRAEKREGAVTPLKEIRGQYGAGQGQAGGGAKGDQVGIMLKTALRLVDDYRSMPRARAHIQSLLESHLAQVERVAELEQLINEATSGPSTSKAQPTSTPSIPPAPKRTVEASIRAEELALKKLEAFLAPHRRPASEDPEAFSESTAIPPQGTSFPSSTPARQTRPSSIRSISPQRATHSHTPAKTPNIHIANSLVNGMTPRRAAVQPTLNRFSPLKLLGTPRAPVGRSGLGMDDDEGPRPIFSRASMLRSSTNSSGRLGSSILGKSASRESSKPEAQGENVNPAADAGGHDAEAGEIDTDETVRFGKLPPLDTSSPQKAASPEKASSQPDVEDDTTPQASPVKPSAPIELEPVVDSGSRKVEGVEVDSDLVRQFAEKISSTMIDEMRQGLKPGVEPPTDVEGTVKHLQHLARSDPPPPPSPSTASSLSTLASNAPGNAPPITQQTILLAHMLLHLLRAPDGAVAMQTLKETMTSTLKARGWDSSDKMVTKILYTAVGKRVVKLDRRGGSGGKVAINL